jgi:hypothetical protein
MLSNPQAEGNHNVANLSTELSSERMPPESREVARPLQRHHLISVEASRTITASTASPWRRHRWARHSASTTGHPFASALGHSAICDYHPASSHQERWTVTDSAERIARSIAKDINARPEQVRGPPKKWFRLLTRETGNEKAGDLPRLCSWLVSRVSLPR